MGKFICPVCEKEVDDSIIPYHKNVEKQIIDVISKMNPRWFNAEENLKCMDYYRALIVNKTIR